MMQHLAIICLCLVTVWGQTLKVVPFRNLGPRIINGEKASKGQFPWQVAIYITQGSTTNLCGGALISDSWILTAGHCVYSASNIRIALGSNQLTGTDSARVVLDTEKYTLHENYGATTLANDIALIPLEPPVTLSDDIQPIALTNNSLGVGTRVTVSGWGLTSDSGTGANPDLYYTDLVTIADDDCANAYGGFRNDGVVCADGGGDEVKGTCECVLLFYKGLYVKEGDGFYGLGRQSQTNTGDSGGPLVILDGDNTVHVGIVSFGHPDGCESGKPAGFTGTSYYTDWIRNKTGI